MFASEEGTFMKLSNNVTNIKYAIRDIVLSAKKVEKQGKKLYYFNIGDPDKFDFDTPDFLKEALVEAITKDNVSVTINAVLYYKVTNAKMSVLEVMDFMFATSQLAQTTLRNVVGEISLDDVLTRRDSISKKIKEIVDKATDPWGIKIEAVELKHVEVPLLLQVIHSLFDDKLF